MGSAEPGGATETRAPVNSDALTTCSELEPTEAAGGDWRELALCLQFNGDLWFPEKGESPAAAKLLCGRCEVRAECLEFALDTNEDYGIWGGFRAGRARLRAFPRQAGRQPDDRRA